VYITGIIYEADARFFFEFFPKTDPPHLFTVRVAQHCVAISATESEIKSLHNLERNVWVFSQVRDRNKLEAKRSKEEKFYYRKFEVGET